jgi:hypothetical protein
LSFLGRKSSGGKNLQKNALKSHFTPYLCVNTYMNKNIIITLPIAGMFLWNVCCDGPVAHPHTIEPCYPTQTMYSVTAPLTGSFPGASWTHWHTGEWTA